MSEHGPLDELRSTPLSRPPLDVAEVRRRGDRRRRTRRVAVASGVAAVTLAVIAPFALLGQGPTGNSSPPVANPGLTRTADPSPTTGTNPTPDPSTPIPPAPTPDPPGQEVPLTGAVPTAIPDDFPLALGYPDPSEAESERSGLRGPSRRVEAPAELIACRPEGASPQPEPVDTLTTRWTNPEDERVRRLMTFATADEAVSWMQGFVAAYRQCVDPDPDGDGYVAGYQVDKLTVGGQAYRIGIYHTQDGEPAFPLTTIRVVRLGLAVLYDSDYGEGFQSSLGPAAQEDLSGLAPLVARMCLFTQAGCAS